jgi:hypothetical protein
MAQNYQSSGDGWLLRTSSISYVCILYGDPPSMFRYYSWSLLPFVTNYFSETICLVYFSMQVPQNMVFLLITLLFFGGTPNAFIVSKIIMRSS